MVDRKHRDFTEGGGKEDCSLGDIDLLAKTFEDFQNGELKEKKIFCHSVNRRYSKTGLYLNSRSICRY